MDLFMHKAKLFLAAAIILPCIKADAAAAPSSSPDPDTVVIEVSGYVPGFTQQELAAWLARKMQDEVAAPWHFAAEKPGEKTAPNKVVWSFSVLKKVWKGGMHNGFPGQTNSVSYLGAEVKLYLKGVYQMTMDTHPSVSNGPNDEALSQMVHEAAHALFIKNRDDTP
jgi:hypothetical protein